VSEKKGEERKADKLGANNHHRNHQFGTTQKAESTAHGIELGVEGGLTKKGGDMDVVLVVGRRGGNRRRREGGGGGGGPEAESGKGSTRAQ